jgi:hypothetical protein
MRIVKEGKIPRPLEVLDRWAGKDSRPVRSRINKHNRSICSMASTSSAARPCRLLDEIAFKVIPELHSATSIWMGLQTLEMLSNIALLPLSACTRTQCSRRRLAVRAPGLAVQPDL